MENSSSALIERVNSILKNYSEIKKNNLSEYFLETFELAIYEGDKETFNSLSQELKELGETNLSENRAEVILKEPYSFENLLVQNISLVKTDGKNEFVADVIIKTKAFESIKMIAPLRNFNINNDNIEVIDTVKGLRILISDITNVESQNSLEQLLAEERNKRLELLSDFQNFQKRIEIEKSAWGAISNMGLIKDILEVHDDIGLAILDEQPSLENAITSLKSAQDKLEAAASRAGIERISVEIGNDFDKEKMEAISTIDAGESSKNKVIAVISSAYKYKNKDGIVSPAKVIVGK